MLWIVSGLVVWALDLRTALQKWKRQVRGAQSGRKSEYPTTEVQIATWTTDLSDGTLSNTEFGCLRSGCDFSTFSSEYNGQIMTY
ncbi:hypothetical protein NEUTE2DRAFT_67933 [Neurospora tetrasperma FGSC 2509]|nr:hypothetical protein NEUTE2DRAFT_67933 [Neurospora tetrasperma FGSC 2509]